MNWENDTFLATEKDARVRSQVAMLAKNYLKSWFSSLDVKIDSLQLDIPKGVITVVVNIIPPETGVPISMGASLIGNLLERMSSHQHLKVYYPDGWIFINEIKENFEGQPVEYIERK